MNERTSRRIRWSAATLAWAALASAGYSQNDTACAVENEILFDAFRFGWGLSVNGDTALIGAPEGCCCGSWSGPGTVYVYQRSGTDWNLQTQLFASDGVVCDEFGRSPVIENDTALVSGGGSVYMFERTGTTWMEISQFAVSGDTLALSGGTVAVGWPSDGALGPESGSVDIFVRSGTTWSLQANLTASDGAAEHDFGRVVALSGDTAFVGAPQDDVGPGAVYIFTRSGTLWTEVDKLTASDGVFDDEFGTSVAFHGGTLVIGSKHHDDGALDTGAVYVFEETGSGWNEMAKLSAPVPEANAEFGGGVAIHAQTIIAAAPAEDGAPGQHSRIGAVHAFVRQGSSWIWQAKARPSDAAQDEMGFGGRLAIWGETMFMTSFDAQPNGNHGAVYIFSLACLNYCDALPNSTGSPARISGAGSPSFSTNNFVLTAGSLPAGENGIFYYGPNATGFPFGDGLRCVGGTVFRLPVTSASATGELTYALDLQNPLNPAGQISAGDTWRFQAWYRDPQGSGGSGFNLSDGIEVQFLP